MPRVDVLVRIARLNGPNISRDQDYDGLCSKIISIWEGEVAGISYHSARLIQIERAGISPLILWPIAEGAWRQALLDTPKIEQRIAYSERVANRSYNYFGPYYNDIHGIRRPHLEGVAAEEWKKQILSLPAEDALARSVAVLSRFYRQYEEDISNESPPICSAAIDVLAQVADTSQESEQRWQLSLEVVRYMEVLRWSDDRCQAMHRLLDLSASTSLSAEQINEVIGKTKGR